MLKLCHSEPDDSMNHSVRRSPICGALPTNVGHFPGVAYSESSCSFLSSRLVVGYSCKIHLTWMTMSRIKVADDWAAPFFISKMNWSHNQTQRNESVQRHRDSALHCRSRRSPWNIPNIFLRQEANRKDAFRRIAIRLRTDEIVDSEKYGAQAGARMKFSVAHHHELIHLDD